MAAPVVVVPSGGLPVVYHPKGIPMTVSAKGFGASVSFAPNGIGTPVALTDELGSALPSAKYLADTYSPSHALALSSPTNTLHIRDSINPANDYSGLMYDPATFAPLRGTFTRASSGTCIDASGRLVTRTANQMRIDYSSGSARLLMEGAATNIILYSEELGNAVWSKNLTSITADAGISPTGALTADLVSVNSTGANRSINQSFTATAAIHCYDFFARAGSVDRLHFGLWNGSAFVPVTPYVLSGPGSLAGGTLCVVTGLSATEWTRLAVITSAPLSAGPHNAYMYPGVQSAQNAGDSVYYWGAEVMASERPNSYIQTVASAVTRAADSWTFSNAQFTTPQATGTQYASFSLDGRSAVNAGNRFITRTSDGTANERQVISNAGGVITGIMTDGGVQQASLAGPSIAHGVFAKAAFAWASGDTALSVNGAAPVTGVGTLPTTNRFEVGVGANALIAEAALFGTRVTDPNLQALAT